MQKPRNALRIVNSVLSFPFVIMVTIYQATLSPDHGLLRHFFPYGVCKHSPTCSEYAVQELKASLFPRAALRILKRVLSCHPWATSSDERLHKVIANQYTGSAS